MRNGKLGALALGLGLTLSVAAPAAAQDFSDEDAFGADFLGCTAGFGIGECTEEVFENLGLEEEEVFVTVEDITPFNPVDQSGSVIVTVTDDVVFPSEVAEEE